MSKYILTETQDRILDHVIVNMQKGKVHHTIWEAGSNGGKTILATTVAAHIATQFCAVIYFVPTWAQVYPTRRRFANLWKGCKHHVYVLSSEVDEWQTLNDLDVTAFLVLDDVPLSEVPIGVSSKFSILSVYDDSAQVSAVAWRRYADAMRDRLYVFTDKQVYNHNLGYEPG